MLEIRSAAACADRFKVSESLARSRLWPCHTRVSEQPAGDPAYFTFLGPSLRDQQVMEMETSLDAFSRWMNAPRWCYDACLAHGPAAISHSHDRRMQHADADHRRAVDTGCSATNTVRFCCC